MSEQAPAAPDPLSPVAKDVLRAERCRLWAMGAGLVAPLPRPLYRPSTEALAAFRSPASDRGERRAPFDFMQDAACPLSLADLAPAPMFALFDAAASGYLRGVRDQHVAWQARPRLIALYEPYRRMESLCIDPVAKALLAPLLLSVRCELEAHAVADHREGAPAPDAQIWQKRRETLAAMLHLLQPDPPSTPDKGANATFFACLLGATCTGLILCVADKGRGVRIAPIAYLSAVAVFALASAMFICRAPKSVKADDPFAAADMAHKM